MSNPESTIASAAPVETAAKKKNRTTAETVQTLAWLREHSSEGDALPDFEKARESASQAFAQRDVIRLQKLEEPGLLAAFQRVDALVTAHPGSRKEGSDAKPEHFVVGWVKNPGIYQLVSDAGITLTEGSKSTNLLAFEPASLTTEKLLTLEKSLEANISRLKQGQHQADVAQIADAVKGTLLSRPISKEEQQEILRQVATELGLGNPVFTESSKFTRRNGINSSTEMEPASARRVDNALSR